MSEEIIEEIINSVKEKGYIDPFDWEFRLNYIKQFLSNNPDAKDLWNAAVNSFKLSSYENGINEKKLEHIIEEEPIIQDLFNAKSLDIKSILAESIKNDGEQNTIKLIQDLRSRDKPYMVLEYIEKSSVAQNLLQTNQEFFATVQKMFDVTTYDSGLNEQNVFLSIEKNPKAAKLLDAENTLNASIKRDEGQNLAKYLKNHLKKESFFDIDRLEYLAKSEFVEKILKDNPDILAAAKKSFNVCYGGFEHDSHYDLIVELSEDNEAKYAEKLRQIAKTGAFKQFFNAEKLIKESANADVRDKFAATWIGHGRGIYVYDIKKNLDIITEALLRNPELIPLIDDSLDIKMSDFRQSRSFADAEEVVHNIQQSDGIRTGYYLAGKLKNLSKKAFQEFKDKENIIATYLNNEELNIFELQNCLSINSYVTERLIKRNPKIKERVEQLFENPKNYVIQKSFQDSRALNELFDVPEKLKIAEANLRKMSGNEVFEILTTERGTYPEAREADRQYTILKKYLSRTKDLSEYSLSADLCYSDYRNDDGWDTLNTFLDDIGTYKCAPEVATMVEDCIGRIFAHYNYYGKTRKDDCYSYVSTAGIKHFLAQMIKEVSADPDSYKSQFYLKHAQNVLDQWQGCGEYHLGVMVEKLLPVIAKKGRFDIYEKIVDIAATACGRYAHMEMWKKDSMISALRDDVNSPISQIYLKNVKKYFTNLEEFSEVVSEFAANDKGAHPEIFDKLCGDMLEIYNASNKEKYNKAKFEDNLLNLCKDYNNPQIVAILEASVKEQKVDSKYLQSYYEKWQRSGLKCFEDLVDQALNVKELVFEEEFADVDYAPLHEKLKKSKIESISITEKAGPEVLKCLITEQPYLKEIEIGNKCTLSPDVLIPAPALEKIKKVRYSLPKIQNVPQIIANLPNLTSINCSDIEDKDKKALVDYLLSSKPEKLIYLDVFFSPKDAAALLEKYPLLMVEVKLGQEDAKEALYLNMRNEQIQKVILHDVPITDEKVLKGLIESKGLVKCLQLMAPEKRPALEVLYSGDNSILQRIKENAENPEEFNKTLKDLLQILGVKDKDVEKLTENSGDNDVKEAIAQWNAQRKIEQGDAAFKAAFKAWQEKNIKK